jgi:pimeloyl-ACP methyl ester carboxylesterase
MRWLPRLLGALLILTALMLAVSRAPEVPAAGLVARWAPAPSDFIAVRGLVVHVRDEGPRSDPEPIVLLHGTSASLHTWDGWAQVLKRQRRVIRMDLPGFGLTGPFGGEYAEDDYRGDTYARFVLDLMDTLQVPRAVLAGNSLGGEIAWRTATLAPQRVTRLVLVDATGLDFQPERIPLGFVLARLPVFSTLSESILPRELVAASVSAVYGDPAKVTPELVDRYYQLTLREGNRRALALRLRQLEPGAAAGRLGQIQVPTLILWGGRDQLVPPSVGEDLQGRIPGSQRQVFPALGHVPHEEGPAETVAAVQAFLGQSTTPP